MDKFVYLIIILTMSSAFSTLNAMNIIDCSSRSIHFDGSKSINMTCGVCCTGGDYCPPQDGEINLQIIKHLEINLTKYNLGWIPDSCEHSLVLCPDCYQNYSTESLLTFEGFNGSYNNFSVIPCFSQWSHLKWIDLSHNRISSHTYPLNFGNNSVIEELMLRGNGLMFVHPKLILNLKDLQYLDLRNNPSFIDYSFTKYSTSLIILDLRFSCGDYVVLCPACETNLTLLVSNSSACLSIESQCNATNCTFSYDDLEMYSSHQCLEVGHSTFHTSTTAITTPSVHSSSVSFNETEAEAFCSKFSNFFHLPLVISQRSYCGLTISVFAMLFVIGVIMIIYLIRWRIKVRREGRYGRWMSIYSPKVAYKVREGKSEDSSNYRVLNHSSSNIRMDCDGTSKHSSRCSISNEEVIIDPNLESLENIRMKCKVTVERSKSHVDDNCKKAVSGSLKSKRKTRSMPGQYSSQRPPQGNNKMNNDSSINTTDVDLSSSENVLRKKKMGGRVPGRRSLGIGKTDYEELSKSSLQNQKCSKSDWKIYDGLKKV